MFDAWMAFCRDNIEDASRPKCEHIWDTDEEAIDEWLEYYHDESSFAKDHQIPPPEDLRDEVFDRYLQHCIDYE